jgi:hypothetical protein
MRIVATYKRFIEFNVPEGVILLNKKQNKKANNDPTKNIPFSWRVDEDTLFYIDADGNEQEIEGEDDCYDEPEDVLCVESDEDGEKIGDLCRCGLNYCRYCVERTTVVKGIVCKLCKHELPPMTMAQHLKGEFNKNCPHN